MPHKRPPRSSIRFASHLRSGWRRERRQHPVAYRVALFGIAAVALSAALVAIHLGVIAQLVGGLAVLPLSLAAFLRLLPPPPWTDEGTDGWRHEQGSDNGGPWPPDEPVLEFAWDRFEREFRAFVEEQVPRVSSN
jgi:hypothetical protein